MYEYRNEIIKFPIFTYRTLTIKRARSMIVFWTITRCFKIQIHNSC